MQISVVMKIYIMTTKSDSRHESYMYVNLLTGEISIYHLNVIY